MDNIVCCFPKVVDGVVRSVYSIEAYFYLIVEPRDSREAA